ncbi:CX domain-containing protein [Caenorhabditis elegans]|uniref:CX domain-containing protein n=1 Tax=Caenorhabditis elegans TaxID=6239 RepID=O16363_CAEEL|nr:CX domain-containing protein [Caenorhabditis elegans]CCD67014.1 CX domain-containing protein [Caenorhabditis elegans]|eukprot:NP_504286.5 Uncharacterized protein CELE_R02F11.2 [Caenorhabditis elegans]
MILRNFKWMMLLAVVLIGQALCQRTSAMQRIVKETFLAGSEYEQSLIGHLLNSSAMVTLNDDITTLLASTNMTYTLASPDEPFVFVERNYFWSQKDFNEYADGENNTIFSYVCVYNASEDEGLFSQIYFPSGDRIQEVVFGCEVSKECCGMKCCGDDVLINIIIVGVISLALLLLLLCNILIGFKKRREKSRETNLKATYQATDTTNGAIDNDIISADQITYDTRHPATNRGSPANPTA